MKNRARVIIPLLLLFLTASHHHGWSQTFKLKNRSSFTSVDGGRNPFWPIGYTPGAPVSDQTQAANATNAAASQPKAPLTADDFNLTSISSFQGIRMAMLSGKPVGEGQMVNLNLAGQRTKVQILKVGDGSVVLRCGDQEITVSLKRPELDLINRPAPREPVLHSAEE